MADQRRRRARDGHDCRTRRARRVVGLGRTMADVPRGRADVPVRGRPAESPARPRCRHHERAEWRRRDQRPPSREELRMAHRQRGTLLSRPSRERPDVRGRDGTASRLLGPFDCHVGPDVLHGRSVSQLEGTPLRRRTASRRGAAVRSTRTHRFQREVGRTASRVAAARASESDSRRAPGSGWTPVCPHRRR